jgi:potassium voltage-gated channel Shal-related subfamily D member 2
VGYGEITPRSFLGRLVTLPLLVFGLLLIALPSFVLGREFSIVWEKMASQDVRRPLFTNLHSLTLIFSPLQLLLNEQVESDMSPARMSTPLPGKNSAAPDLTNLKLAENQTELSRQISDLRSALEEQGVMIKRLTEILEISKGKQPVRS